MKYFINRFMIIFPLLCLIILLLPGCWDNTDVTEMSMVSAIGIDKADENKIEFTIQIVRPDILKAIEQGSSEDAFSTVSATGETIYEAIRNLLATVHRKPFYSHMELMIIGEDIAAEGIMEVLDLFERDYEPRRESLVLVAKGISAKEVLNAKSRLGNIPTLHIVEILKNTNALPTMKEIIFIDLLKEISSPGKSPIVGAIQTIDSKEKELEIQDLKVEGGAIFKKSKLVGWLTPMETRGYLFVNNEVKSGIINIPNPLNPDKKVSIEMKQVTSKIDVEIKNGNPLLLIEIKEEGNLGSQQGTEDLTTKDMVNKIEKEVEEIIKEEVRNSVEIAQKKYKSDIFGFGEVMHRKYLDYWNKVKDDWDSEFEALPVEIKVESKLIRPGLIKRPLKVE